MTAWLKRRMASVLPVPAPVEAESPEPPKITLLERIAKWQQHYARERQAQPTREQLDQAQAAVQARRQEAAEEEFARSIARRGVFWPGESADDDGPSSRGGFAWIGGVAEAQRLSDFDWPAQARERQGPG